MFDEDAPQQELDLGVEAAKVTSGPALQRVQDVGIDSQEEWFSFGHDTRLLVDGAGVDHGLGLAVSA